MIPLVSCLSQATRSNTSIHQSSSITIVAVTLHIIIALSTSMFQQGDLKWNIKNVQLGHNGVHVLSNSLYSVNSLLDVKFDLNLFFSWSFFSFGNLWSGFPCLKYTSIWRTTEVKRSFTLRGASHTYLVFLWIP